MKKYKIDCVQSLEGFLKEMNGTCDGFSPDSDFRDFADKEGKPLFTDKDAAYLNKVLLECYRLCAKEVIDIHMFHSGLHVNPGK